MRGLAAAKLLSAKLVRVRRTASVLLEDQRRWGRPYRYRYRYLL